MQGESLAACMRRSGIQMRRIRKGVTDSMRNATESMIHTESHLHDMSRTLLSTCNAYAKAVKDARKADKAVAKGLDAQTKAIKGESALVREALADSHGCDDCGPDF